ncbi:MAG: twin-arginine translocase TatA/TatE family subunit [Atopobiaceae bacterium]|nr:twin-arginine translocase TatA/TatE family subunit [Atopobiaceae bacterium]
MNLGPMEIVVILVVVLLIFGPKNLPKLGSAVGKTVKNVREGMDGAEDEEKDEPNDKGDASEKESE